MNAKIKFAGCVFLTLFHNLIMSYKRRTQVKKRQKNEPVNLIFVRVKREDDGKMVDKWLGSGQGETQGLRELKETKRTIK